MKTEILCSDCGGKFDLISDDPYVDYNIIPCPKCAYEELPKLIMEKFPEYRTKNICQHYIWRNSCPTCKDIVFEPISVYGDNAKAIEPGDIFTPNFDSVEGRDKVILKKDLTLQCLLDQYDNNEIGLDKFVNSIRNLVEGNKNLK